MVIELVEVFVLSVLGLHVSWTIRGVTIMRYINLHFTYLLTYQARLNCRVMMTYHRISWRTETRLATV